MARPRKNDAKAQGSLLTEKKAHEHEVPVKEQPYPLPDGWKWVRLISGFADCLDKFRKPINSTERAMREGAIPYYGATGQVGWINDYLTDEHLVLIGEDGAPFLDVIKNKAYIIEGKAWVNNHAHILRSFYGKNGNLYLMHYLNTFNYTGYVNGTTRLKLTQRNLNAIPIPLPPFGEQKRIVDRIESLFGKLDEAKEKAEAVLDGFETRKAAILHKAFTGELTAKWREEKNISLESWDSCPLIFVLKEKPRNGYSPKPVEYKTNVKSMTLSATTSGFFRPEFFKYIDEAISENSYLWLSQGDILIQRANSLEKVGTSAIYTGGDHEFIYPDLIMKLQVRAPHSYKYIAYILSTQPTLNYFRAKATGTAGNMPKINQQIVSNTPIVLPSCEEQNEIVRILDSLFAKEQRAKEAAENVLNQIELIKKAILAKAFRGELTRNVDNQKQR